MLDAKVALGRVCIGVKRDDDPCASITCHLPSFYHVLLSKVNSAYKSSQSQRKPLNETLNWENKCFFLLLVIVFYSDSSVAAFSPQLIMNDA